MTSSPTGHASAWPRTATPKAAPARSSGRRSRSSKHRRRARRATWCWCRASSRRCAGARSAAHIVDLAEALGVQVVVTLGALLGDVPHTRPVGDDRPRLGRGAARAPGHPAVELRGADGHRRRPAHGVRERRAAVGERVGVGAALRGGGVQPEGRAGTAAQDRRPDRGVGGRVRARELQPPTTSARSGWRCAAIRISRRSSNAWSRRRTAKSRARRRTCRRGTSSPANFSGFSGSVDARGSRNRRSRPTARSSRVRRSMLPSGRPLAQASTPARWQPRLAVPRRAPRS